MVNHNQTIRRLLATNFLCVFDHFYAVFAFKELTINKTIPNLVFLKKKPDHNQTMLKAWDLS